MIRKGTPFISSQYPSTRSLQPRISRMRSIALSSESLLSTAIHSSSPYSTTPKPLNFLQLCIRPKTVVSSRVLVNQSFPFSDAKLSHYHDKVHHMPRVNILRVNNKNQTCGTTQPVGTDAYFSNSNELMFTNKSRTENLTPLGFQVLDMSSSRYLKFMVLCGIFALQNTGQAVAGSDISTGFSVLGDLGDISTGFASAFLLIFFSELGDKTFFIAALLAARNSAAIVFLGTFGALGVMTIISVVLGRTFHYVDDLLPFRFGDTDLPLDDIAAVLLLVYFGVSTLLEASSGDGLKAEEEQKEAELAVSEFSGNGAGILAAASTIVSTFLLVFVAEWGDKSFFSTIALAASSSPLGVVAGSLAGHGVATLLAVLGGSLLGTFLSEKLIAYIGGTLFLVFAAVTLIEIVNK